MQTHPAYTNKNGIPIDTYVNVYTRPNFRGSLHEMQLYRGKGFLDNIFDKKIIDDKIKLVFAYYPETWCNIVELQNLMQIKDTCIF